MWFISLRFLMTFSCSSSFKVFQSLPLGTYQVRFVTRKSGCTWPYPFLGFFPLRFWSLIKHTFTFYWVFLIRVCWIIPFPWWLCFTMLWDTLHEEKQEVSWGLPQKLADDICLLTHRFRDMEGKIADLRKEEKSTGFINKLKTQNQRE